MLSVTTRISLRKLVRRLTADELVLYGTLVPAEMARGVWLVQLPALPGPYAGLTLSRLVVIDRTLPEATPSTLLAHELVHVRQFHEKGLLRFTWDYNRAFVTGLLGGRNWSNAYRAVPAEVEARQEAGRWAEWARHRF